MDDLPQSRPTYLDTFDQFDAPYGDFEASDLGSAFADELAVSSRLWTTTGYGQGVVAYLNFFLLTDFIVTHDQAYAPRFQSFRSMAQSFYRTDVFVREVTDSGKQASGGISNPKVRRLLKGIMARHQRLRIPTWMMTYFGFQLLEAVEVQCGAVSDSDKQLHLAYLSKAFRIMGIPFSDDRALMERFARAVEEAHAGPSPHLEKHARHILRIGEMVGVSSTSESIYPLLPEPTRKVYQSIESGVRPSPITRVVCRVAGRLLIKRAVGKVRQAVPWQNP